VPVIEDQPKATKSLGKGILLKAVLLLLFVVTGLCAFFYFDSIGSSMFYGGQPEKALEPTKRALWVQQLVLGHESLEVANTEKNLARVYDALSKYAEAEPLYASAVATYEKKKATDQVESAHILSFYGDHQLQMRQGENALRNFLRAKEIMVALKQNQTQEFAWVLQRERNALNALGRKQEALVADAQANQILQGK